jgi:hypothetical protein
MTFLSPKAQSHVPIGTGAHLPIGGYGYTQWPAYFPSSVTDSNHLNRQWQIRPYASLSMGYVFLHGGMSFLSVPAGLALVHPFNKNVSAFAGVSAAPVIFSVNRLYTDPALNPSPGNIFSRPYGFGLNARVEAGLMYTNDAKTFSISGSVGVERGGYPVYPNNRTTTKKQ